MIRAAAQDWRHEFAALLKSATHDIVVCSPFVGMSGTNFVQEHLPADFSISGRVEFLTNLSVGNVCQRATDPRALKRLTHSFPNTTIHHIPGLHAKTYVVDFDHAIITSGNLTAGGLYRNLEHAVVVSDSILVRTIRSQLMDFASLGAQVPHILLDSYCDALEVVLPSLRREQQLAQGVLRQRFADAIQPLEDELIKLRLAGGAMHTVFARTIQYLLRTRGPLMTVQMHPMIAAIHPDLCDDAVDRVIDGRHFGKKWKHAVRTAQQQLKERGVVEYASKFWSIKQPAGF
jgi:hypothetical protein